MIHCMCGNMDVFFYTFWYTHNKNTTGSLITYYGRDKFCMFALGNGQLMRFIVDSYVAFFVLSRI